jgi:hypothetical protein
MIEAQIVFETLDHNSFLAGLITKEDIVSEKGIGVGKI